MNPMIRMERPKIKYWNLTMDSYCPGEILDQLKDTCHVGFRTQVRIGPSQRMYVLSFRSH